MALGIGRYGPGYSVHLYQRVLSLVSFLTAVIGVPGPFLLTS